MAPVIIIAFITAFASLLTFFSGFGLATMLTPVMVLFFPVEVAIPLTGIVHLLNNFFKIGLVGKQINWPVGLKFGIPAILGAFIGAEVLLLVSNVKPLYTYLLFD